MMTGLLDGARVASPVTARRDGVRRLLRVLAVLYVVGMALILAKAFLEGRVVINRTPSVPRGIYWLTRGEAPERGRVVAFPIPEHMRALFRERRLVPSQFFTLLAKPVAAVAGDHVCLRAGHVFIAGQSVATVAAVDHQGRQLPHVDLCRELTMGEVFVLTPNESFDSRYFGPISRSAVRGSLTLLVEF